MVFPGTRTSSTPFLRATRSSSLLMWEWLDMKTHTLLKLRPRPFHRGIDTAWPGPTMGSSGRREGSSRDLPRLLLAHHQGSYRGAKKSSDSGWLFQVVSCLGDRGTEASPARGK